MHMCVCVCYSMHVVVSRQLVRVTYLPSIWVLGIKLRLLRAGAITHYIIYQSPFFFLAFFPPIILPSIFPYHFLKLRSLEFCFYFTWSCLFSCLKDIACGCGIHGWPSRSHMSFYCVWFPLLLGKSIYSTVWPHLMCLLSIDLVLINCLSSFFLFSWLQCWLSNIDTCNLCACLRDLRPLFFKYLSSIFLSFIYLLLIPEKLILGCLVF